MRLGVRLFGRIVSAIFLSDQVTLLIYSHSLFAGTSTKTATLQLCQMRVSVESRNLSAAIELLAFTGRGECRPLQNCTASEYYALHGKTVLLGRATVSTTVWMAVTRTPLYATRPPNADQTSSSAETPSAFQVT